MRGGYRQGAGRKQGFAAKNAEEARKLLSESVAQEIQPIMEVLISKAKEGDIRAIKELFDRAWGKSPQSLGITPTPSKTEIIIRNPEELLTKEQKYRLAKRVVSDYENKELREAPTTARRL